jgi:hypothetical protein
MYRFIGRCKTPPPPLTSPEWDVLPDDDPRKVGAVCVFAEAHAQEHDNLAPDLWLEMRTRAQTEKSAEDEDYVTRAEGWRQEQRRQSRKSDTFMVRRQRQIDGLARTPRPGDFTGRGSA